MILPFRLAGMLLALAVSVTGLRAEGESVDYWRAQLRSADPQARMAAARGLAMSGVTATPAVGDLAAALQDPDPAVRVAVAEALRDLGAPAGPAATALARTLSADPDATVRQSAARALTRLGVAAQGAVPVLVEGLTAHDAHARRLTCGVLGSLGLAGAAVREGLVQRMVRDPDSRVRQAARTALKQLRVELAGHVPDLVLALQDASPDVRENAAEWLGEVRPRPLEAVDPLLDLVLYDSVLRVRDQAARSLRDMGTDASGFTPRLMATLRDGDRDQREAAAAILGSLSIGSASEVDALLATSSGDDELSVRLAARGSLVRLVRTNRFVFDRFVAAAGQRGPGEARAAMIDTLGRLGEEAAPAVPNLLIALRDGPEHVREEAARALGRIGTPAFDALLPLRRAAAWDRALRVRDAADRAIKSIRTASGRREPERIPGMAPAPPEGETPELPLPGDGAPGGG